jgi:lipid-binding SYLF domain-containing protein
MRMKWAELMVLGLTAVTAAQAPSTGEVKRIAEAAAVLREIHAVPDKDIPQSLWTTARCGIVIPGLKRGAFIVGGEYGKGLMSCRNGNAWGAPVFMEIEKGSWGFQVGAEEVDLVMLVTNERGIDHLLQNKVTLGTEASVAAGPVGRDAQAATDAQMHAEILSWSRSRGVFAGINIAGGVMKPDSDDNQDLYGHPIQPREVLLNSTVAVPDVARPFIAALRAHDAAGATQQP